MRHRSGFNVWDSMRTDARRRRGVRCGSALLVLLLAAPGPTRAEPIPRERVLDAAHACARYLIDACGTNGQFVYRVNLASAVNPEPRYNLIRHAGAVYALAHYQRLHPSPEARDALERACRFLRESAVAPLPDMPELRAVWSEPGITHSPDPLQAKLGATGLALAALARAEAVSDAAPDPAADLAMGRFLLFMQREDGSFHSKFIPEADWRGLAWASLYYPGEATLGLIALNERDPHSGVWEPAAARGLDRLSRRARDLPPEAVDHWSLIALERFLACCESRLPPERRARYLDHARRTCEQIVAEAMRLPSLRKDGSPLTPSSRTAQTATRIEALLAGLRVLPEDEHPLRERALRTAEDGLRFLIASQVRTGPHAGGIPRWGYYHLGVEIPDLASLDARAGEVRIDYVQHALSALLMYDEMTGPILPSTQ